MLCKKHSEKNATKISDNRPSLISHLRVSWILGDILRYSIAFSPKKNY